MYVSLPCSFILMWFRIYAINQYWFSLIIEVFSLLNTCVKQYSCMHFQIDISYGCIRDKSDTLVNSEVKYFNKILNIWIYDLFSSSNDVRVSNTLGNVFKVQHTRTDYEKMQSHLSTYMAWPCASWSIQRSCFMCDFLSMVYPQSQMISSSRDVIILFYLITKAKETHLSRDNHELYWYSRLQKYEVTDKYMIIATWQNVQGPDTIRRCHLTSIGNPIVEMRRSYDRLISTIGFPILVRWHLYIESGPWATYVVINHIKFHSSADFLQWHVAKPHHYSDVVISAMASHINSVSSVCSTVFFSGVDQEKSKIRVPGRCEGNPMMISGSLTWKMFPFDDVIM